MKVIHMMYTSQGKLQTIVESNKTLILPFTNNTSQLGWYFFIY